mgnify:CR=1 FL=1|jgi:Lrp/AsnC family leucine-responsive transcriptional regulator
MKIDKYDRAILNEIQRNGRITNAELAEKVGLSPSPCLRRTKQLEDSGLILRHVTLLDRKKLGLDLMVYVQISMDRHTPERFERFENTVATFSEVLECHLITGQDADYLLKVVVKDMDDYQRFLLGYLTRIEGVSGVHSSFVLKQPVMRTELPV